MKNIIPFILLFLTSCSTTKNKQFENSNSDFEDYVKWFKVHFVSDCIHNGTYTMLKPDNSTCSDFCMGLNNYKLIDSLADKIDERIYRDSVDWANQICKGCSEDKELLKRYQDAGMVGTRTLKFCLEYYTSEELDSIARANVKKMYIFSN